MIDEWKHTNSRWIWAQSPLSDTEVELTVKIRVRSPSTLTPEQVRSALVDLAKGLTGENSNA